VSADAAYMRTYRRRHPEYVRQQVADNRARRRALERLALAHGAEFWHLYTEERNAERARLAAQAAEGATA
jgi:hypothetical protein